MSSFTRQSPGVVTREIDLTTFVANEGMSAGAFVGDFVWGPALKRTQISRADELQEIFGKPNNSNFVSWFSAADFLAYTGNLYLVRAIDAAAMNSTNTGTGVQIKNDEHFAIVNSAASTGFTFAAKYPGALGDSLSVHIADAASFSGWAYEDDFDTAPGTSSYTQELGGSNDEMHIVVVDRLGFFTGVVGAVLERYAYVSKALDAKDSNNAPNYYASVLNRSSKYVWAMDAVSAGLSGSVGSITVDAGGTAYTTATVTIAAPSAGGVQATATATIDAGVITGITITEAGSGYTSVPSVTITGDGSGATATAVLDNVKDWGTTVLSTGNGYGSLTTAMAANLSGGADSTAVTSDELIEGYDLFSNAEEVDVSLIFLGDAGGAANHTAVVQHVIDNIAERRRDCMVFFSPTLEDVLNKTQSDATDAAVARRNTIARSSSFAVMDTGWKTRYDVFNDAYRWVPLNADIAGLCAQVDRTNDSWWSPGGYTRGRLKNVDSLVFNPTEASRDRLYKVGINPVVTFNVDGTILYGDKTLQGKQSAFSQIGVRRLFILLQKSIARSAKYSLFEFNDAFTRSGFVSLITPYLREIKGRRGMADFFVQCDETNNTDEVIQRGEFVASIFIKPQYSIQWITLNFVAVRREVAFSEVVGVI